MPKVAKAKTVTVMGRFGIAKSETGVSLTSKVGDERVGGVAVFEDAAKAAAAVSAAAVLTAALRSGDEIAIADARSAYADIVLAAPKGSKSFGSDTYDITALLAKAEETPTTVFDYRLVPLVITRRTTSTADRAKVALLDVPFDLPPEEPKAEESEEAKAEEPTA